MKRTAFAFLKSFGGGAWPERVALCLAVLVSYASVWPNTFVFDDMPLIVWNDFLKHWSGLPELLTSRSFTGGGIPGGFYRPVQMLIYFLIYQAFGASAIAFHALNIGLQALNACLLREFGIRAGFRKGAAFAAALLWALHPLNTTDVAYMASTAELLWSCFCLVGLMTLLPDFAPRKIGQAMIFFALSLGSKETAVVFPALAAITFFFVSKERAQIAAYLRTWPLWLLTGGYIAVWSWFMHKSGNAMSDNPQHFQDYTFNFINRILTSLGTLPVYARLMLWPTGLHLERVSPVFSTLLWQPLAGALLAGLGLLQILWGGAKRGLALSFGLLWFAIALSPYTGVIVPINAVISEGWMYMPMAGLFLGITQTVAGFFEKRQNAARLIVLALALSLGAATFRQNEVWRSTETLYKNIPPDEEYTTKFSLFLGPFYMQQGDFDKAITHLQHELDHDGLVDVARAEVHLQLGMAWLHIAPGRDGTSFTLDPAALKSSQHIPEAIAELGKALQDSPNFYWAHAALAVLYRYQGDNQMADFHDRRAREILQKQGGH